MKRYALIALLALLPSTAVADTILDFGWNNQVQFQLNFPDLTQYSILHPYGQYLENGNVWTIQPTEATVQTPAGLDYSFLLNPDALFFRSYFWIWPTAVTTPTLSFTPFDSSTGEGGFATEEWFGCIIGCDPPPVESTAVYLGPVNTPEPSTWTLMIAAIGLFCIIGHYRRVKR